MFHVKHPRKQIMFHVKHFPKLHASISGFVLLYRKRFTVNHSFRRLATGSSENE